jgi:hypothetical protein
VPDRQHPMVALGGQGSSSGRVMEKELLQDGEEEKVKGDLTSMMVSQKNRWAVDGARGRGGRSAAPCARCRAVTEPPQRGRVHACALAGTRGHGPLWAAGKRALLI